MTSFLAKTRTRATAPHDTFARVRPSLHATVQTFRIWLGAAARAHERRCACEALGADTMRDTGLPPEVASGMQAWQPDLPFFMQSGFGKR
jgi:hypothetical protein